MYVHTYIVIHTLGKLWLEFTFIQPTSFFLDWKWHRCLPEDNEMMNKRHHYGGEKKVIYKTLSITADQLFARLHWYFCPFILGKNTTDSRRPSNSFRLEGLLAITLIFSSFHRFSIGVKSGLWLGHCKMLIFLSSNQFFTTLAACFGSLLWWNVLWWPRPSFCRLPDVVVENLVTLFVEHLL